MPFAALADGVRVEDAVGAAHDPARGRRVGEADARREVVAIGMDERALERVAVSREDHRAGHRIEVGEAIVLLARRRRVFVAHAEVQRQPSA